MRRNIVLLLFLGLLISNAFSQNPGNIGTANLTAWFNPDNLTLGNTTAWTTTLPGGGFPVTVNDLAAPYPQATNTPPGATSNYNTTVDFTGNTTANLLTLENGNLLNLLDNTFSNSQGTFFAAYFLPTTSTQAGGHVVNYREGTSGTVDGIQFRVKLGATTGRLAIGSGGNTTFASHDWVQDYEPDIISYKGNRGSSTSMQSFQRSAPFTGGGASSTTGDQGLYIGSRKSGVNNYNGLFDGYVHELIFYNRDLTAAEMARIHTYLGVKYGITLDNTGGGTQGDYISTSGTNLWDASLNAPYHNQVIGIGRDDAEGLLQKQSHTFDDHCRIYLNTLQPTNVANTGVFAANESYVLIGNNTGGRCATNGVAQEIPATPVLFSRMGRELKLTKTNFAQTFNLDIRMDTCAVPAALDPTALRLLIDDDGDFTNATVFNAGGGLTFSYNQGVVTISGISAAQIPNNATRYLTLGYSQPRITLSGGGTVCEGDSIPLFFDIQGATGPIDVTYTDGTNTFTVNNVVDGDSVLVAPTVITTYSVSIPQPFNCCNAQVSSSATVFVNPSPTVTANATATTLCTGDSVQLNGAGAASYAWDNGATDGTFITPTATTTYTVTGTAVNGCTDTAQITITVNPTPSVTAQATATEICIGDSVQLTGVGAVSYTWDNNLTDGDFVSPTLTTTYTVIGTNGNNCADTANVTLTVNPLPNVQALTTADSVCEGESVVLTGAGAATYTWNNGVVDNQAFEPTATSTYTVIGTDANSCVDSAQITITFLPAQPFSFGEDTVICPGLPIILEGDPSYTAYLWQDGSTQDTFRVTEPGTYTLSLTDSAGCFYADEIIIDPAEGCDSLFIPNVFTPNGDGINELFQLESDYLNTFEIQIFDRWGKRMFASDDVEKSWDGTGMGGVKCASGVYYYVVRFSFLGDPEVIEEKGGFLSLIR